MSLVMGLSGLVYTLLPGHVNMALENFAIALFLSGFLMLFSLVPRAWGLFHSQRWTLRLAGWLLCVGAVCIAAAVIYLLCNALLLP